MGAAINITDAIAGLDDGTTADAIIDLYLDGGMLEVFANNGEVSVRLSHICPMMYSTSDILLVFPNFPKGILLLVPYVSHHAFYCLRSVTFSIGSICLFVVFKQTFLQFVPSCMNYRA